MPDGSNVWREQDIWKFEPEAYYKEWLAENEDKYSSLYKWIVKNGLKEVDRLGTPVIVRTPWYKSKGLDNMEKLGLGL
jgi:hypothetical protein